MQALQDRSNQYDSAITTLVNKAAPGADLAQPAPAAAAGTGNPPAPVGAAPAAAPPQGQFTPVPDNVPSPYSINGKPIYPQNNKWVYKDGSPAQ
jgi:hypothetical protein